jgi:hypothetical protein
MQNQELEHVLLMDILTDVCELQQQKITPVLKNYASNSSVICATND